MRVVPSRHDDVVCCRFTLVCGSRRPHAVFRAHPTAIFFHFVLLRLIRRPEYLILKSFPTFTLAREISKSFFCFCSI